MTNTLAQLWAVTRCESRIHWRRRGLKVMFFAYILLQLFFCVTGIIGYEDAKCVTYTDYTSSDGTIVSVCTEQRSLAEAEASTARTSTVIMSTWVIGAVFALTMFPMIMAEAAPRDRQFGVRELLDSLPVSAPVYLAGKVLGAWISVVGPVLAVMVGAGVVWRLAIGPYQVGPFLAMMFFGVVLLIVLNGSLTVLAAAGQPNATRALLAGLVCVIIVPSLLSLLSPDSPVQLLSPFRLHILLYYMNYANQMDMPKLVWFGKSVSTEASFALSAIGGLVELAVAGGIALYVTRPGGKK